MGAGHVEAEGFRSAHQLAQVGVTAKQVVDEISSKSLFLADQFAARLGMAVREEATASSRTCRSASAAARTARRRVVG